MFDEFRGLALGMKLVRSLRGLGFWPLGLGLGYTEYHWAGGGWGFHVLGEGSVPLVAVQYVALVAVWLYQLRRSCCHGESYTLKPY